MQMNFRRLLGWQTVCAAIATAHTPTTCARIASLLSHSTQESLHGPVLALVLLQGWLVPLLFSYMLEKLSRTLFLRGFPFWSHAHPCRRARHVRTT